MNNRTIEPKVEHFEMPIMLSLSKALLCLDCDTIFTRQEMSGKVTCPACGGKFSCFVSKFLNRKE